MKKLAYLLLPLVLAGAAYAQTAPLTPSTPPATFEGRNPTAKIVAIQKLLVQRGICSRHRAAGALPSDKTPTAYAGDFGIPCADVEAQINADNPAARASEDAADLDALRAVQ